MSLIHFRRTKNRKKKWAIVRPLVPIVDVDQNETPEV